jgi:hypothetical protein
VRPRKSSALIGLPSIVFFMFTTALAVEHSSLLDANLPCAVVDDYQGEAQVLDPGRSNVADVAKAVPVLCGGWISVAAGWVKIRHKEGFWLNIGPGSFVQVADKNTEGHLSGEQVTLYRGEIYGTSRNGARPLRIMTPNSRIRLEEAAGIVIFNHDQEETQLTTLDAMATIENRFEYKSEVKVPAGEASSLNLKLMRVHPTVPAATSVASLRPKMIDLHLSAREQELAIDQVMKHSARSQLATLSVHGRNPASGSDYRRHPHKKGEDSDEILRADLINRVSGGLGSAVFRPTGKGALHRSAKVIVVDTAKKEEDDEKKRLIRELSEIKDE